MKTAANNSRAHKDPSEPRRGKTTQSREEKHEPRLPHERDESTDSGVNQPRQKMRQAKQDVERGLQDTSKGEETDRVYRRNFPTDKT
jgi:hypothetical protein